MTLTSISGNLICSKDLKVIDRVVRQYSGLKSSTGISNRVQNLGLSEDTDELAKVMKDLADKYSDLVSQVRAGIAGSKTGQEFMTKLRAQVQKLKAGNCAEQSYLVHSDLKSEGMHPRLVQMIVESESSLASKRNIRKLKKARKKDVEPNKPSRRFPEGIYVQDDARRHQFVIAGLSKDAKLNDPTTWGNNAIIADAWAGIAMPAQRALQHLKIIFRAGANDKVTFKDDIFIKTKFGNL